MDELIQRVISSDNAEAQYELGVLYENQACGLTEEKLKRFAWLGDNSQELAEAVHSTWGIAAQCFRAAADLNHVEAQFKLGTIYKKGLLGQVCYDEAERWYKLAAEGGHPEADNALRELMDRQKIHLNA